MDQQTALQRLAEILAQPRFQPQPLPLWERWWVAIQDAIADALLVLLGPVRSAAQEQVDWLALAVFVVAALALTGIVVLVGRALGLAVVRDASRASRAAAERRAHSDRLWREAQALADAGRYAEAARSLYLSTLYALEEHAVIRVQTALTNREHADRVRYEHPDTGGPFAVLVAEYDRVRYGAVDVDRETFATLRGLAERARAA